MILIMKNKNKRNFLMIGVLALCTSVPMTSFAQEDMANEATTQEVDMETPWNLEKCIDYAIAHNITIKTRALTAEEKELSKLKLIGRQVGLFYRQMMIKNSFHYPKRWDRHQIHYLKI